jgi:hypothetical protein
VTRALAIGAVALAVLGALSTTRTPAQERFRFGLVVHADRVDEGWLGGQLEQANALFAPAGVSFVVSETRTSPAVGAIEDRTMRDGLGARVAMSRHGEPTRIHVFLTERLVDIDDPPNERMGVHWRRRRDRRVHYVIVSTRAWPTTLAHELGHYFGNPHSRTPNNLMSYDRDGTTPPFFDPPQLARIRSHARRYARAGLGSLTGS